MEQWTILKRWGYGAVQCFGMGLVVGALEMAAHARTLKLTLGIGGFVMLGVVSMLTLGVAGFVAGLPSGIPNLAGKDKRPADTVAAQMGICSILLCGLYLWQGAYEIVTYENERWPAGVALGLMPVGFGGIFYYNARYWLRRRELEMPVPIGWLPAAAIAGLVIVSISAVIHGQRDTGGAFALEGDRPVVIVTVDGLGAGQELGSLSGIAASSAVFDDAVTPSSESLPANGSVLTGLHPLRHRAPYDGMRVALGLKALPELLEAEGYATGAFVSRSEVAMGTGVEQGFRVFDDDFSPLVSGLASLNLWGHVFTLGKKVGLASALPQAYGRSPQTTVASFEAWLNDHADVPFLAWVHLDGRGRPDEVDDALATLLGKLDDLQLSEALLIIAGTSGASAEGHGLYDAQVHVPLVLRGKGVESGHVSAQVRLMDLPNTVLKWLELDEMDESEGVELVGYTTGRRSQPISCTLIGRDEANQVVMGVRNNGVKVIFPHDGEPELYVLADDPKEQNNQAAAQENTVKRARLLLGPDEVALDRVAPKGPPAR